MNEVWVISLGGSLIAPDRVDTAFVAHFCAKVRELAAADTGRQFVVVCGGGAPARQYQAAYRELAGEAEPDRADWVGIAATRLNAELLKQVFGPLAPDAVVTDPTAVSALHAPALVAAGWKPGFSHDFDAVILAERLHAARIVKLSNVMQIHSADPRTDPTARPFDRLSWSELQQLTGDHWHPGHHAPFDPIATHRAAAGSLTLIVTGSDLANLHRIVEHASYTGTTVGPE